MNAADSLRSDLIEIGRRLDERGLIAGTDGNLSARLDNDRILITGSGLAKGRLSPDDFVVVDSDGNVVEGSGEASSEARMHLYIYRERPDVGACVHAHPPFTTAFAVAGVQLNPDVLPEVVLFVGDIPLTKYAPPGTDAVPESLSPHIQQAQAFMLKNHGLLTVGPTPWEALHRHETVEHFAHILYLARKIGHVDSIPKADLARLTEMRERRLKTSGRT